MVIPEQVRHHGVHQFPSCELFPWWLDAGGCTDVMESACWDSDEKCWVEARS